MDTWAEGVSEHAPFGIAAVDRHRRVQRANAAFRALVGLGAAQVAGQALPALVVSRDRGQVDDALARAGRDRGAARVEHRLAGPDGPVWCRSTVVAGPDGGWLVYVQDVSRERRAVLALRETERQYREAFDSAPIGQAICTLDGVMLRVNAALVRTLGRDADALCGGRLDDHALDAAPVEDRELEALVHGAVPSLRMSRRLRHADGATVHAEVHLTLRRDGSGQPAQLLLAVDDTTRRVIAEQERAAAQARLVAAMEDIERSNADLEHFAAVASHDLRAPLATVIGFLQTLDHQDGHRLTETGHACLEAALRGADRLQRMVSSLLEHAVRERGPVATEPVDLGDVAKAVVDALDAEIARAGATVSIGALPTVPGDRFALDAIVQNLVSNALKFRRDGQAPTVVVTAERVGSTWQLVVEDDGIGVPPEDREAIFERFSRTGTGARFEGSGIGLATVARAVERHGGTVWVEDAVPHGSRFVVSLPDREPPDGVAGGGVADPAANAQP